MVAVNAPTIAVVNIDTRYTSDIRNRTYGMPPSTSIVIEPFVGDPVQFVLLINVFCMITGVMLKSFTVNTVTAERHSEVVFVAITHTPCCQCYADYIRCARAIYRYACIIKPFKCKTCSATHWLPHQSICLLLLPSRWQHNPSDPLP